MKIIIVGAGRRGFALARYLIDEKNDVVVIDDDADRVRNANDKLDCLAIAGSGLDIEVLRNSGVQDADAFVAITDRDEVNLISCGIVSSEFNLKHTIASVSNLEYTGRKKLLFGVSHIVNPEEEAAHSIYNMIDRGIYRDVVTFSDNPFILCNTKVSDSLADRSLFDVRSELKTNFVITAILRKGQAFVPSGKTVIKKGDIVSIVADKNEMNAVLQYFGQDGARPKKIVLVGATLITEFLLTRFPVQKLADVVLIDEDEKLCKSFAERFPEILVLHGDLSSENIIEDERLNGYDLLVSLENSDELNTIMACYAKKKCGIKHTIALVKHKNNYASLAPMLGIDMVISTTDATVMSLLGFINGGNISSIHSIFDGRIEIYEFVISGTSAVVNKKLMEIDMKGKAIIAAVRSADGTSCIPGGQYFLKADDILILIVSNENVAEVKKMIS